MNTKRKIKLAVISDTHLGTYGAHAEELADYLKSIEPEILILNGDIVDGWAFTKRYWPASHTKVLQRVLKMMSKGTTVYYLTGNHDDMLRRYSDNSFGNFHLLDKLHLTIDGKKHWFFHGDVFDITMKNSRWLAKLGGEGYDILILLNRFVNHLLGLLGREKISFSKRIKNSVKHAVKFISDFETTVSKIAIEEGNDYVVCGHIHQPEIKTVEEDGRSVVYMNSGDWIENLSALEYADGQWSLYHYAEQGTAYDNETEEPEQASVLIQYENLIRHTVYR